MRLKVPLSKIIVLVVPFVNDAPSWKVPPTPLNVIGKSIDLEIVIVLAVAFVLAKVVVKALADTVPPDAGMV